MFPVVMFRINKEFFIFFYFKSVNDALCIADELFFYYAVNSLCVI